jgi:hypothetical protein
MIRRAWSAWNRNKIGTGITPTGHLAAPAIKDSARLVHGSNLPRKNLHHAVDVIGQLNLALGSLRAGCLQREEKTSDQTIVSNGLTFTLHHNHIDRCLILVKSAKKLAFSSRQRNIATNNWCHTQETLHLRIELFKAAPKTAPKFIVINIFEEPKLFANGSVVLGNRM